MIERQALLTDLQKLLPKIEADLLERSDSAEVPDVGLTLRKEFTAAQAAERTAQSFTEWRSDQITQAAVAWLLSCVFVRFLEDNQLLPSPRLAGPKEGGLERARDEHELYFRTHPAHTDRHYLLDVFTALTKFAATRDVFGAHNPIHSLPNWLSGDAAGEIITFFQKIDPNSGRLIHDFTDPSWDTRFLGDLYQDLSESARKKFALLQTPVFVEEFILDRTLDPALGEFGLAKPGFEKRLQVDSRLDAADRFRMIDPACGSGHFLLGSFTRLLDRWRKREPATKTTVLVQRSLDSIHGVDLNPFAIAIARFRLLLAALNECGLRRLSDAPGFEIHLACGDSLLHGSPGGDQGTLGFSSIDHVYQPEDRDLLDRLLRPGRYHAVVANPPYITPKDPALSAGYRERYSACYRQYSLAVPFLERIMSLAVEGGFTGQITANSFMKREFGKKLIEEIFPRIDLTHVIDTSGLAFGTAGFGGVPTLILLCRSRQPIARTIRTVMGIRGEPGAPEDPAKGLVWSAIVAQIDVPGSQSDFVSVGDSPRELFHKHPWSIRGGGASELKERLGSCCSQTLSEFVELPIGRAVRIAEDEVFIFDNSRRKKSRVPECQFRGYLIGESVRDWSETWDSWVWYPYAEEADLSNMIRQFWPWRTTLANRSTFQGVMADAGLRWYEYMQHTASAYRTSLSIAFAELGTHNQFVLDGGGKVFKQTAPVIKLPSASSRDEHLAILGLLNSSTACFWIKQVFQNKGSTVDQHGARQTSVAFENFWQLDSTKLKQFPIPADCPLEMSRFLDELAAKRARLSPSDILRLGPATRLALETVCAGEAAARSRMITLQEELDWQCYRLYGLIEEDLTQSRKAAKEDANGTDAVLPAGLPPLQLGQRAFEIVMARKMAAGELTTTWFARHGSTPITELPADWADDYRRLVLRRIELIESDPNIRLIEQPEYKRRWNTEPWESQLERALRGWLLDRLESYFDFDGRMNDEKLPTARLPKSLTSVGKLADVARQDIGFLQVGELYRDDDAAFDVAKLVAELVEAESVPHLPVLRYKPSGLLKRAEWEKTWDLQRQEDAINARTKLAKTDPEFLPEDEADALKKKQIGTIAVPPKFTSADFFKSDFWRLRGKLDVPKERWLSFPRCEGPDGTLVIAWAGDDHLQHARAISEYYVDVQERLGGRDDPRLVPLLASLIELLPWIKQWHNEIDPEFGVRMGEYFEGFLQEESRQMGLTLDEIIGWQPPQRSGGRRRSRAKP